MCHLASHDGWAALQVGHAIGRFGDSEGGSVQHNYPSYGNGYGGNYPDGQYYPPGAPSLHANNLWRLYSLWIGRPLLQ